MITLDGIGPGPNLSCSFAHRCARDMIGGIVLACVLSCNHIIIQIMMIYCIINNDLVCFINIVYGKIENYL